MTYPTESRFLVYQYSAGINNNISRLSAIADSAIGGGAVESYHYLGLDAIIQRNQPRIGEKLTFISDTPADRWLVLSVADDGAATPGKDKFGNTWMTRINPDGTQTWVQSRNNIIINGGVDQTPRVFNQRTGLSSPVRPQ